MLLKLVTLLLLCNGALASIQTYEKYKVYDVTTEYEWQKQFLLNISSTAGFDLFSIVRVLTVPTRIMVEPKKQNLFEKWLSDFKMHYTILVEDMKEVVERDYRLNNRPRFRTAMGDISFTSFNRHAEMNAFLDELAKTYPSRVSVKIIGKSYENRDMKTITITNGDGKKNKNVILVDAGIHAREWIAPAAALYVIHQLVEKFTDNSALLEKYDYIVLPLVNPDGYEYSHTNMRMWRKTRKPITRSCFGTDANRNFDFHWGEVGASNDSCSDDFMGTTAFSDPESQVLRDLILSLKGRGKFYLTLHASGNLLLYPWGWTGILPKSWFDNDDVARAGADAIFRSTGTIYTVGSSTNVLYAAAGGSDDYAFAIAKFPVSITMELSAGGTGFDPEPVQILPFVTEAWVGIKAMFEKVIEKY